MNKASARATTNASAYSRTVDFCFASDVRTSSARPGFTPAELFAAQGFPPDYVLSPKYKGKHLTKTQQIDLAGNSVCPPVAEALVRANVVIDDAAREVA